MSQSSWSTIITPQSSLVSINTKEIFSYRDLLWLFVKRDIVTIYKQTILGPIWYFLQPVLTTGMFTFVFGRLANISTDGAPHVVFYLLGVTIWNYFSECLTKTSNTFVANQGIFGKVYFPRVIVPASLVISGLGKFLIQFLLFLGVLSYYFARGQVAPNWVALLTPFIVFVMAVISLGFGMVFSSMTTKYRDLAFLLNFGVQLWMYATPVIYPISTIPKEYVKFINLNPITPLVETMRYGFLGVGDLSSSGIIYSFSFGVVIFFLGFFIFNKVEKTFLDTV